MRLDISMISCDHKSLGNANASYNFASLMPSSSLTLMEAIPILKGSAVDKLRAYTLMTIILFEVTLCQLKPIHFFKKQNYFQFLSFTLSSSTC